MRVGIALGLMVLLANPLFAIDLPRGALWRVEQTCMLNQRATGSPFPCLEVNEAGGYAVLRAPFRQTHIVTMPTARVTGVEDPVLAGSDHHNYFEDAWNARHYVEAELKEKVDRTALGLAVNSTVTRSQDQLHIHVDCVDPRVRDAVAARLANLPTTGWAPDAFRFHDQSYAARRVEQADLRGVDPFLLVREIPAVRQHPARTVIAVLGARMPDGKDGFVILAGQSDPHRSTSQSTSEDLLDHKCRRPTA